VLIVEIFEIFIYREKILGASYISCIRSGYFHTKQQPFVMKCDRPFIFMIVGKHTKIIPFISIIGNPTE